MVVLPMALGRVARGSLLLVLLPALVLPSALSAQTEPRALPEPIAAVRADSDGDGMPDRSGETVTVAGRATTAGTALAGHQLRLFIQDGSAGIELFAFDPGEPVERGDSVVATGTVGQYQGLTQLRVERYRVVPGRTRVPEPVELPSDPGAFEAFEGSLVRARGVVKGTGSNEGGSFLLIGSSGTTDELLSVFVARNHQSPPGLESFRVGDDIEVIGPLGQFDYAEPHDEFYQVYPRDPRDLESVGWSRVLLQRIALGGTLLLGVAMLWLFLLRARVRHRTRELAESERAARESEARLSFFLDHAPVALWTVDRDLRFTWVEGAALATMEVPHDQLVGLTVPELFDTHDPDDPPLRAYRRALEGEPSGFDVEWEGRIWEVRLQPLTENGEVTGVVGAAQDVTAHRTAETRLEEQRAHLQRLFDASPEAIVLVDGTDRVLQVNPEFEKMFGYQAEEAKGHLVNELIGVPGRENEAEEITRRVAQGERVEMEAVRRHRDGTPIEVSILATPVDVDGERRVYGIYRDITEQKSLEAQLLHSQRLEAVGRLAGGVAHDFNNILTAILGHTRVLLEDLGDDERSAHDLEQIEASAERAAQLTRQLLTFSRHDLVSVRAVDLSDLVRQRREFLERLIEERVELRFELADDLPRVEADPGRLEQVVMNLVINARDATSGGGVVTVSTWQAEPPEGESGPDDTAESWVILEVRDQGRGMAEEERVRIFEPFFTTKAPGEGTGLGLSTVYGIVEQAGGVIRVETEPEEGTAVRVCLPPLERAPETASPSSEASSPGVPSMRGEELVLLVDDDQPVRDVTRRILEREGFRVVTAESAAAALEYAESSGEVPDAVVTDIVMPGMDGCELARRLRQRFEGIGVLLMTGYAERDGNGALEGELGEVLRKPFDARTLVRRLTERLAGG